jgi:hypothetical protein
MEGENTVAASEERAAATDADAERAAISSCRSSLDSARALADAHLARMQESCALAFVAYTVLQLSAQHIEAAADSSGCGGAADNVVDDETMLTFDAACSAAARASAAACSAAARASAAARSALGEAGAHAARLEETLEARRAAVAAGAAA